MTPSPCDDPTWCEIEGIVVDQVVGFIPTSKPEAALAFYRDVLGLTVVDTNPYATVLVCASTTVRVTTVESFSPQPFTILGFTTADLRVRMTELGSTPFLRYEGLGQDADGVWSTRNGDKVVWFNDPDGNVLSLTELAPAI